MKPEFAGTDASAYDYLAQLCKEQVVRGQTEARIYNLQSERKEKKQDSAQRGDMISEMIDNYSDNQESQTKETPI